jgi:hypothetical protein
MCSRSNELFEFCHKYGITTSYSSPYHPQGNGQAKSSNKNLLKIIKRMLDNNKKAWDTKLNLVVRDEKITLKKSTCYSSYNLVYGKEAMLPLNNLLTVYMFMIEEFLKDIDFMEERINALVDLDEIKRSTLQKNIVKQKYIKFLQDKGSIGRSFKIGDWALRSNVKDQEKGKHGKHDVLWLGPFVISVITRVNSYL